MRGTQVVYRRKDRWGGLHLGGEFGGGGVLGVVREVECESDSCPNIQGRGREARCQAVSENSQLTYCDQIELLLSALSSRHTTKEKSWNVEMRWPARKTATKIRQRRQREPDLQQSTLKLLDISKFIVFSYSYCKFELLSEWQTVLKNTHMHRWRKQSFCFEVFVRFFQFSLKVWSLTPGQLGKALWKNSLNDNISVGVAFAARRHICSL